MKFTPPLQLDSTVATERLFKFVTGDVCRPQPPQRIDTSSRATSLIHPQCEDDYARYGAQHAGSA